MSGFKFRLQRVLQVRIRQTEDYQRAMAEVQRLLGAEERKLAALLRTRARTIEELRTLQAEPHDPREVMGYLGYLQEVERLARDQQDQLHQARIAVEEARVALLAALQEQRKLEKVREKRLDVFRVEAKRGEQKAMDEIVTTRTARLRAGSYNLGQEGAPV